MGVEQTIGTIINEAKVENQRKHQNSLRRTMLAIAGGACTVAMTVAMGDSPSDLGNLGIWLMGAYGVSEGVLAARDYYLAMRSRGRVRSHREILAKYKSYDTSIEERNIIRDKFGHNSQNPSVTVGGQFGSRPDQRNSNDVPVGVSFRQQFNQARNKGKR